MRDFRGEGLGEEGERLVFGLELAAVGWFVMVGAFRPKPQQYEVLRLIIAASNARF